MAQAPPLSKPVCLSSYHPDRRAKRAGMETLSSLLVAAVRRVCIRKLLHQVQSAELVRLAQREHLWYGATVLVNRSLCAHQNALLYLNGPNVHATQ